MFESEKENIFLIYLCWNRQGYILWGCVVECEKRNTWSKLRKWHQAGRYLSVNIPVPQVLSKLNQCLTVFLVAKINRCHSNVSKELLIKNLELHNCRFFTYSLKSIWKIDAKLTTYLACQVLRMSLELVAYKLGSLLLKNGQSPSTTQILEEPNWRNKIVMLISGILMKVFAGSYFSYNLCHMRVPNKAGSWNE